MQEILLNSTLLGDQWSLDIQVGQVKFRIMVPNPKFGGEPRIIPIAAARRSSAMLRAVKTHAPARDPFEFDAVSSHSSAKLRRINDFFDGKKPPPHQPKRKTTAVLEKERHRVPIDPGAPVKYL